MNINYNNQQADSNSSFDNTMPSYESLPMDIEVPPTLPNIDGNQSQTTYPASPMEPARPAQPSTPMQPARPAQPSTPMQPARPVRPSTPMQPARPVWPSTPTEPARPIWPSAPMQPARPVRPGYPIFNNNYQMNICMNRLTFVWDNNNESYWIYPMTLRNNTLYGYRWNSQAGWFAYDIPLWQIRRYSCIG